ncbi:MAG TPA: acyl-CoA dehydrogenase family protein [Candidatus Binatia bacterium]|jgi:acyl-CoA dehydrogenase|nr:acyl-CoA dehydrogenase family protein [Candidatus Binatia bacterium]
MDFALPEELQMLKQTVRQFVDKELIPIEMQSKDGVELKPDIKERLQKKTREMGLWMLDVPEEYGGAGLNLLAQVVVWEELARSAALPSRGETIFGPEVRPILYSLNDAQKQRYFYPVVKGEKTMCFAQTEPDAGSDPGSMKTRAVREGDHYVVNGVKRFITDAEKSDFAQVMVVTDPAKGSHGGISCLLVDMDTPGVKITARYKTIMGDEPCEIVFEDAKVPAGNLVGKEGEGFKLAQKWLSVGRLRHGARALGVAERCIEMGARYAKQRVTFGKPLAERQAIQWKLADSYIELHSARLMVYQAAWKSDQGDDARNEAYMAKLYADEMSVRVVDRVLQIHGGIGLTLDLPLAKWFVDQRSRLITEGASEVMRMVIARHVLNKYQ